MVDVTILTPWAPVEKAACACSVPGVDDVLIIGSRSRRGHLGIQFMTTLGDDVEGW